MWHIWQPKSEDHITGAQNILADWKTRVRFFHSRTILFFIYQHSTTDPLTVTLCYLNCFLHKHWSICTYLSLLFGQGHLSPGTCIHELEKIRKSKSRLLVGVCEMVVAEMVSFLSIFALLFSHYSRVFG